MQNLFLHVHWQKFSTDSLKNSTDAVQSLHTFCSTLDNLYLPSPKPVEDCFETILLAPPGALIAIPTYYRSTTHFFRSHRSSILDFHFLSHYSYITSNHWTLLLATSIPHGYNRTSLQDSARWCKMVQDGAKWCNMVQHGATWCNIVQDGARWCKMVQNGAR